MRWLAARAVEALLKSGAGRLLVAGLSLALLFTCVALAATWFTRRRSQLLAIAGAGATLGATLAVGAALVHCGRASATIRGAFLAEPGFTALDPSERAGLAAQAFASVLEASYVLAIAVALLAALSGFVIFRLRLDRGRRILAIPLLALGAVSAVFVVRHVHAALSHCTGEYSPNGRDGCLSARLELMLLELPSRPHEPEAVRAPHRQRLPNLPNRRTSPHS